MRKLILCTTVATIAFCAAAFAQVGPKGGFNDPNPKYATVEQALKMKDDSYVTLQGKIQKKTGHEDYIFADNTGSIKVEIDDDVWQGLVVNPNDTVEIKGEVDKGWKSTEIEVSEIRKINQ